MNFLKLQRLSRGFEYKKKAYREFSIDAIYLMGSSGTIAYNDKSDFDIWICHNESLDAELVEEFSSLQYGSKLYVEVVRKVLQSRSSGETYDIYVTDIDLSPAIISMDVNSLQSSRYLYFKRKIEENLKKAVLQL